MFAFDTSIKYNIVIVETRHEQFNANIELIKCEFT